jgi:hypothetical protein
MASGLDHARIVLWIEECEVRFRFEHVSRNQNEDEDWLATRPLGWRGTRNSCETCQGGLPDEHLEGLFSVWRAQVHGRVSSTEGSPRR